MKRPDERRPSRLRTLLLAAALLGLIVAAWVVAVGISEGHHGWVALTVRVGLLALMTGWVLREVVRRTV
jgi:hypothetical protein